MGNFSGELGFYAFSHAHSLIGARGHTYACSWLQALFSSTVPAVHLHHIPQAASNNSWECCKQEHAAYQATVHPSLLSVDLLRAYGLRYSTFCQSSVMAAVSLQCHHHFTPLRETLCSSHNTSIRLLSSTQRVNVSWAVLDTLRNCTSTMWLLATFICNCLCRHLCRQALILCFCSRRQENLAQND